jgi:hypothetical protein
VKNVSGRKILIQNSLLGKHNTVSASKSASIGKAEKLEAKTQQHGVRHSGT